MDTVEAGLTLLKQSEALKKSICLFGGEPLLHKDMVFAIIGRVKNAYSSFAMSITTNGVLLTPEVYHELCMNEVFVTLSIDSFGENNDVTRVAKNKKSAWKNIIENISNFDNLDSMSVRMTITPENVCQVSENINKIIQFGIKNIAFYLDYSSKWTESSIEEYRIQFREVLKIYNKCNERFYIDVISKLLRSIDNGRISIRRCRYGWSSLAVVPSGNAYMCHRQALDSSCEKIGNIYESEALFRNLRIRSEIVMNKMEKDYIKNRCGICPMYLEKGDMQTLNLIQIIDKIHIDEISAVKKKR